jgi:hypothetical protein
VRYILSVILAVCTVCFSAHFALAEKRVALVIGNSAYQNVPRLTNPARDAAAIGEMFRAAQFDVVEARRDLGIVEMRRAMRDFSDKSRDADISVVYFAGHGIEVEGINYLIPIDAVLERDRDAFDEAIQLDRVLQVVEPAKRMRLIILDACRDNPFQRTMKRTIASRTLERGLSTVEPTKPNTLIAFAAKSGSTADDGNGTNSPFTTALLKHLPTPGLDLRKAFGLVRDDVMKATNDKQEPFVYGSLGGTDVSLVPVAATSEVANQRADVRRDYELAERIGTPDAWDTFLRQYPAGLYSDFAKAQLRKLLAEDARLATAEKARQAEAEKARLAAAGAKAADQARAARAAKTAEEARIAAEKKKLVEQVNAEAAERARADAEKASSERLAKEKAEAEVKAAEAARKLAEKAEVEKTRLTALEQKKAADSQTADPRAAKDAASKAPAADVHNNQENPAQIVALPSGPEKLALTPQQMARSLQTELRRVGCQTGEPGDDWTAASRRALGLFNKNTGLKFDVKVASIDALEAVRGKSTRICPLICDHGFRPEDGSCVKITCSAGSFLNDDNECEKRREREKADTKREKPPAVPPSPEKKESSRSQTGGSCSQMHDPLGCSCALKSGGHIYAGAQGYRWRWADYNAHVSCLYAAGRR